MKYIASWTDEKGRMKKKYAEVLEAKSIYDAKTKFLKLKRADDFPDLQKFNIGALITQVRAKCLEDNRKGVPLPEHFNIEDYFKEQEELVAG